MKYLAILLVSVIGLAAAGSYGEYIPKAFFIIDEDGNASPARPINAETLNRVRRQIQPIQPFGQPGFGFQPFPFPAVPLGGQGQGSFVSSSQTLNSRFGEDEPVVQGQSTVFSSNNGQYQQHTTNVRPDGSVTYNKQSGRVKRQQTQTQSQDGQAGQQQQSQTQSQGVDSRQTNPSNQHIPQQGNQGQGQSQGQQHPQGNQGQGQQHPQGNQGQGQQYPQGNQGQGQQYPQGSQGQGQQYPQGNQGQGYQGQGQQYPQGNQQPGFGAPFGFGAFGPNGFPFAPGFAFAPFPQVGFPQPAGAFGGPGAFLAGGAQPGPGTQTIQTGSTLDNRFGEDGVPTVTGGSQTITSMNGNFHSTTSILKPDGQVITTQQSGKFPEKKN